MKGSIVFNAMFQTHVYANFYKRTLLQFTAVVGDDLVKTKKRKLKGNLFQNRAFLKKRKVHFSRADSYAWREFARQILE
jgi:hypothetical protein